MPARRTMSEEQGKALEEKLDLLLDILKMTEGEEPEPIQNDSEILEPCPFCGNRPLYIVDREEGILIMCARCRVHTPGYFDNRCTQTPNAITLARKTWNIRRNIE